MRLREIETNHLSYAEEKALSQEIDAELGFAIESVEAALSPDSQGILSPAEASPSPIQTWKHLSPQTFQTPYPELIRIIEDADPEHSVRTWVDLGAAYGRLGIILNQVRTQAAFIGIEIVPERVQEAKRVYRLHGLDESSLSVGDCANDPLPEGELYFIYDFGTREARESALQKLKDIAKARPVMVVGRGRGIRDQIERKHPWLSSVVKPLHREHYSIYRSRES